jgi:hypothetical protein
VYGAEIPHYFRDLFTDNRSVAPQVYYASGLDKNGEIGSDPRCVVSIIGCTGDWFGGWDGLELGSADRFITADLKGGRLPQVIDRGEPAILVCHWPGIYFNGLELGFTIFKQVVERLHARYDNLIWMKNSEIARYWAAKELTAIEKKGNEITFKAPFGCPGFTVQVPAVGNVVPELTVGRKNVQQKEVTKALDLKPGTFHRHNNGLILCLNLPKGGSSVSLRA